MSAAVNFLPWRQSLQRKRLRLGGLILAGTMLTLLASGGSRQVESSLQATLLICHVEAERQLIHALSLREEQLRLPTGGTRAIAASTGRAAANPRLAGAAGGASRTVARAGMADQPELPGRRFAAFRRAGAFFRMARDKDGRWLFNYRMKRRAADAAP